VVAGCTFLTTGKTQGFALSSLYAPMPRSTFLSEVSFLYAAISPKSGSSAACGTTSAVNIERGLVEPIVWFLTWLSRDVTVKESVSWDGDMLINCGVRSSSRGRGEAALSQCQFGASSEPRHHLAQGGERRSGRNSARGAGKYVLLYYGVLCILNDR
jgi:hypothetical protein